MCGNSHNLIIILKNLILSLFLGKSIIFIYNYIASHAKSKEFFIVNACIVYVSPARRRINERMLGSTQNPMHGNDQNGAPIIFLVCYLLLHIFNKLT